MRTAPGLHSIAQLWQEFRRLVLSPDLPLGEVAQCRRLFYSGCMALLTELRQIGGESVSEEDAAAYLLQLEDELADFHRDLRAGRA